MAPIQWLSKEIRQTLKNTTNEAGVVQQSPLCAVIQKN